MASYVVSNQNTLYWDWVLGVPLTVIYGMGGAKIMVFGGKRMLETY